MTTSKKIPPLGAKQVNAITTALIDPGDATELFHRVYFLLLTGKGA